VAIFRSKADSRKIVIGLPKTFNTWVVVSFLHMWILKVRIRQLPRRMSEHWNELLTNHFFWEAEKTMDFVHKMDATQRKKYLDQYFQIWTGMILAYDEGLIKGDAVLAAAVWRMLFDADPEVEPIKIALVVAYMRREVARIGQLDDNIIARGYVGFGEPVSEMDILKQSPSMRAPFRAHEDSNAAL
jgi:cytochrome b pre-mRNA-processing protein 3